MTSEIQAMRVAVLVVMPTLLRVAGDSSSRSSMRTLAGEVGELMCKEDDDATPLSSFVYCSSLAFQVYLGKKTPLPL